MVYYPLHRENGTLPSKSVLEPSEPGGLGGSRGDSEVGILE